MSEKEKKEGEVPVITPEEIERYEKGFYRRTIPNAPAKSFLYFVDFKTVFTLAVSAIGFYWAYNNRTDENVALHYQKIQYAFLAVWLFAILKFLWSKLISKKKPVYLIDFATCKPDPCFRVGSEYFDYKSTDTGFFNKESIDFQLRVLSKSSIGENTCFPLGVHTLPPSLDMDHARKESDYVFEMAIGDVLKMTNMKPTDIDALIVNSSLFCPTPSLASMIIRKFKMRENILAYNLGGMGCSAGLISIDLAKDLLQVHKNMTCLVVSTENITQNWYKGNEKGMLITNTLFRMGASAVILSNKASDKYRAKYELEHLIRVHKGCDDEAYKAVYQEEDEQGFRGVRLSRQLIAVAGKAIESNLSRLGPLILPWSEKLKFVYYNIILRKMLGKRNGKPYVPNFSKAVDHFCIHAGGRGVLDTLGTNLGLTAEKLMASRASLYSCGNTSSASIWYELEFIENMQKPKSGQRVLQLAFGSGFKCNSGVWRRL